MELGCAIFSQGFLLPIGGGGDEPLWQIGRGTQGAIAGCHCRVLWWGGGRVKTNFWRTGRGAIAGRHCQRHLARGWAILLSPQSPFEHSRCFDNFTKNADGASDLLEVLRNSPLEKLNFGRCSQIPSTAWQRVPSGAWPALCHAPGIPEKELSRIAFGGATEISGVGGWSLHQILLRGQVSHG